MSSHYQSSHNAASHYLSSHYGRILTAIIELIPGGSSDPAKIAQAIAPKVSDPMLRAKLLREDEEILTIILSIIEAQDE